MKGAVVADAPAPPRGFMQEAPVLRASFMLMMDAPPRHAKGRSVARNTRFPLRRPFFSRLLQGISR